MHRICRHLTNSNYFFQKENRSRENLNPEPIVSDLEWIRIQMGQRIWIRIWIQNTAVICETDVELTCYGSATLMNVPSK
jgi:hypothetical protein